MDEQAVRRGKLREAIRRDWQGNVSRFATAAGKKQSQIADMLDARKPFGEKVARSIESAVGWSRGWLDEPDAPEPITDSAEPRFERRHIALLQSYLSLPDEQRFAVRMLIETLAGAQNPRLQKFMRQIEDHNHVCDRARPATTQPAPAVSKPVATARPRKKK